MWIFNKFYLDFLAIYLPTILGIVVMQYFSTSIIVPLFLFITLNFIDVGHVYTTNIKTLFDKKEFFSNRLTWVVPLFFITLITSWWVLFDLEYFWIFVVYYTIYHNLKQGIGLVKWYEKKNKNIIPETKFIYYGLTFIPWIFFHFRNTKISLVNYYFKNISSSYFNFGPSFELIGLNFENIYVFIGYLFTFFVILFWIIFEIGLYNKSKKLEINRILCILNYSVVYIYSFFIADTVAQMLSVLVLPHGIPYIGLLIYRRNKVNKTTWLLASLLVIGLAVIGGLLNIWHESFLFGEEYIISPKNWKEFLFILLYITPILSHFVWDSYLWKSSHPESKLFY